FLHGQPVLARPLGPVGRGRRWCRRNPWVAGLSAALLLAFVVGSAAVVWQWRRAEIKASEAEANYVQARAAVDTFYKDVYEKHLLDRPGQEKERRHLLRELLRYYRGFADQRGKDLSLKAEVAEAYFRIGMMESVVGSKTAALDALLQAIQCYDSLNQAAPNDDRYALPLARSHSLAGLMLVDTGRSRDAVPHYEAYHAAVLKEYQAHPDDPSKLHAVANS
ncbi:MAG TPA: hypothetical protein VFA18_25890, partial [Gemmataceae bacterium]|nr:hypothetical protein [Gemmataceae bacterium]